MIDPDWKFDLGPEPSLWAVLGLPAILVIGILALFVAVYLKG